MTPAPVRWMLLVATATVAVGLAVLARLVINYLANPRAISSTAGLPVFRVGEGYVSYTPFVTTIEPTIIGAGVALVVASVFLAAAVWRPRR